MTYEHVRVRFTRSEKVGEAYNEVDICTIGDDDIITLDATTETDATAKHVPCSTLSLTTLNTLPELSDIEQTAKQGKVKVYLSFGKTSFEWFMSYFIDKITRNEETCEAEIIAYDYLYYLSGIEYNGYSLQSKTFSQIANGIIDSNFPVFGALAPFENGYPIDFPNGQGSISTRGFIPKTTMREAFRLVAEASSTAMCFINDRFVFKAPMEPVDETYIGRDYIVEGTHTVTAQNDDVALEIKYYGYGAAVTTTELAKESDVVVSAWNASDPSASLVSKLIDLQFFPVDPSSVEIYTESRATHSHIVYGDTIGVTLSNITPSDYTTFITIIGKPYAVDEKSITIKSGNAQEKEIIDNRLIGTKTRASSVYLLHNAYDVAAKRHSFELVGMDFGLLDCVRLPGMDENSDLLIVKKEVRMSAKDQSVVYEAIEHRNATALALTMEGGTDE